MASKADIIEMLKRDAEDEHAAIVQYVRHAYAIGETGEACEIEAIAREEMYHFKWLSEMIVKLGGKPTIERGALDIGGPEFPDMMQRDVAAEERAIAQYREQIEAIDDEQVVRLLKRILSDEEAHKSKFEGLVDEVAELPAPEPEEADTEVTDILNVGVRHEYTVILQYLFHSLMMSDCEVSRELEFHAINEMQHLGWLSEEAGERGGTPDIEHTEIDTSSDPAAMLQADIDAERAVTADYERQIGQLSDKKLKGLLARIKEHEIYHDEIFSELLKKLERP